MGKCWTYAVLPFCTAALWISLRLTQRKLVVIFNFRWLCLSEMENRLSEENTTPVLHEPGHVYVTVAITVLLHSLMLLRIRIFASSTHLFTFSLLQWTAVLMSCRCGYIHEERTVITSLVTSITLDVWSHEWKWRHSCSKENQLMRVSLLWSL